MEDYYEYLDSNGVTTLYKLIKDDTVALIDSYSVTINGITTNLDNHVNNTDIHTPIATIEGMIDTAVGSLNYATPDYVDTKVAGLVNSAPETLDTLKELSDALGNDSNFATTVVNQIGSKASKDDVYTKLETNTLLEGKANSVHNHVVSDITDFPTIPTKTSQLINDSGFLTSSNGLITSVSWSDITNKPSFSDIAISGSYNDLVDTPTIPTKTSDLTNDSGYITSVSWGDITNKPNFSTVATSGSYTDLSNTPTIPTKVSQLENDMGFGTGGDTSDCVHKTGNETINGAKTFTTSPFVSNNATTNGYFIKLNSIARNEVPSELYHASFRAHDKNNKILGEYCIEKSTSGDTSLHMNVRSEDSSGNQIAHGLQFRMTNDGSAVRFIPSVNNKVHLGDVNAKWAKVHSDDVVHTSGNEAINGYKFFNNMIICCENILLRNTQIDLKTTPTSNLFAHCVIQDKNEKTLAYLQYGQKTNGIDDIGLYLKNKSDQLLGIQLKTTKELLPIENNTYSLGASGLKWANVYSTNTITNTVITYSVANHNDTSSFTVSGGSSWDKGSTLFLYGNSHSNYPGAFDLTAKNTTSEIKLIGFPNGSLTWGGKSLAIDENLVHRSGNETINGVKYFNNLVYLHNNMSNKNSQMDLFTTPANTLYSHYMFVDKNNEVSAYMQYGQQNTGTDFIGLFIHGKNRALHGIQVTTNNELIPIVNNTYSLGSPNNVWRNAYIANTYTNRVTAYSITHPSGDNNSYFYMSGGSDYDKGATLYLGGISATNFTPGRFALAARKTDGSSVELAGSPNGTLTWGGKDIATTEWVRAYVNSVVGSGSSAIGSSISAYWSTSSYVTAMGTASSTSSAGYYPACYSNWIDITPVVGTIYSGAQLYTVLNASASARGEKKPDGQYLKCTTTVTAQATFSNPISSTGKYLCTTANTVRFVAYGKGSDSGGSASVEDNTSTKSIFIRVE